MSPGCLDFLWCLQCMLCVLLTLFLHFCTSSKNDGATIYQPIIYACIKFCNVEVHFDRFQQNYWGEVHQKTGDITHSAPGQFQVLWSALEHNEFDIPGFCGWSLTVL